MGWKVIMNCSNDYAGNKKKIKNFQFCGINRIHVLDISQHTFCFLKSNENYAIEGFLKFEC